MEMGTVKVATEGSSPRQMRNWRISMVSKDTDFFYSGFTDMLAWCLVLLVQIILIKLLREFR
jgi:hypothetical protein